MSDIADFELTAYANKVKVKLSQYFNKAPCHEGVLEEWRYSSTHF
jgi:hypothetical protein